MTILDLTMAIPTMEAVKHGPEETATAQKTLATETWSIRAEGQNYSARVHHFSHWGMSGTYLDLPGHVIETDDGHDAATFPIERLYRIPATVLRPRRTRNAGAVTAADLEEARPPGTLTPALVVNALGTARFDEVPERTVFLRKDAVQWMIDQNVKLLVSDAYESNDTPQNVFPMLFAAGIATVCCPDRLSRLSDSRVMISAIPLKFNGATQLPCRLIAEKGGAHEN